MSEKEPIIKVSDKPDSPEESLKKFKQKSAEGLEELKKIESVEDDRLKEEKDPNSPLYRPSDMEEAKSTIMDAMEHGRPEDEFISVLKNFEEVDKVEAGNMELSLVKDKDWGKYVLRIPLASVNVPIDDKLTHAKDVLVYAVQLAEEKLNKEISLRDYVKDVSEYAKSIKVD